MHFLRKFDHVRAAQLLLTLCEKHHYSHLGCTLTVSQLAEVTALHGSTAPLAPAETLAEFIQTHADALLRYDIPPVQ